MKQCPTFEQILDFIQRRHEPDQAEIAAHIMVCDRCKNYLRVALENIMCEDPDNQDSTVTPLSFEQVWPAISFHVSLCVHWNRFYSYMEDLMSSVGKAALSFSCCGRQESEKEPRYYFGANLKQSRGPSELPTIRFVSRESTPKQYTWEVLLQLPLVLEETSELLFAVSHGNGFPLQAGQLIFQGIELEILSGVASMSVLDFKKTMHSREGIKIRFADGQEIEGDAQFMD